MLKMLHNDRPTDRATKKVETIFWPLSRRRVAPAIWREFPRRRFVPPRAGCIWVMPVWSAALPPPPVFRRKTRESSGRFERELRNSARAWDSPIARPPPSKSVRRRIRPTRVRIKTAKCRVLECRTWALRSIVAPPLDPRKRCLYWKQLYGDEKPTRRQWRLVVFLKVKKWNAFTLISPKSELFYKTLFLLLASSPLPEYLENLNEVFHEKSLTVMFDDFSERVDVSIVEHRRVRIRQQFYGFVHIDWLHLDAR